MILEILAVVGGITLWGLMVALSLFLFGKVVDDMLCLPKIFCFVFWWYLMLVFTILVFILKPFFIIYENRERIDELEEKIIKRKRSSS